MTNTATIKPNSNYLRDLIRDYGAEWAIMSDEGINVKLTAPPFRGDRSRPNAHVVTWVFLNKDDVLIG